VFEKQHKYAIRGTRRALDPWIRPAASRVASTMKLKTFATNDPSSSYHYLRGLPVSRAQLDSPAHEEVEEELPSIETCSTITAWTLRSPRLIGERAHRFHFLDADAVDFLQVDGNYVTIHVGDDWYLTRSTLKHLSDVLAPYDFIRIDRSVLLNLRQVDYIERLESGQFSFQLRRGQQLVSNRERSSAIVRLLRSGVR
jgi:two-component system LytT family response regulator